MPELVTLFLLQLGMSDIVFEFALFQLIFVEWKKNSLKSLSLPEWA